MEYHLSPEGKAVLEKREGCKLSPYYATPKEKAKGIVTIGYGNTYYEDGTPVKIDDKPITQAKADKLFNQIIKYFEDKLNPLLLHVYLNQNQYDAVFSFVYNIGMTNFVNSTMYKMMLTNNLSQVGLQFTRWVYQDGKILDGLVNRRKSERDQFFSGE